MAIPSTLAYTSLGPCTVSWGESTLSTNGLYYPVTAATSLTVLGKSDNAQTQEIEESWDQYKPNIADFGKIPLPGFNLGEAHRLRIPLTVFNNTQLLALKQALRGTVSTVEGASGKLGAASGIITLQLAFILPGTPIRTYPNVHADPGSTLHISGARYDATPSYMLNLIAYTNPSVPPADTDPVYTVTYN